MFAIVQTLERLINPHLCHLMNVYYSQVHLVILEQFFLVTSELSSFRLDVAIMTSERIQLRNLMFIQEQLWSLQFELCNKSI